MKLYSPFLNKKIKKVNRRTGKINGKNLYCSWDWEGINKKDDKIIKLSSFRREYRIDGVIGS